MKLKTSILLASMMSVISANAALVVNIQEGLTDSQLTFTISGSHTWATDQNIANIILDQNVDYDIFGTGLNLGPPKTLINSDLMISINGAPGISLTTLQVDHDGNPGSVNEDDFGLSTATATNIASGNTVVFSGSGTIETNVSNAISQVNAGSFTAPNGGGIDITVTTVPEPSSSLLAALGLAFVACRRKR